MWHYEVLYICIDVSREPSASVIRYTGTSETSVLYCVTYHKVAICIFATHKFIHLAEILLFNWCYLCRFYCTKLLISVLLAVCSVYCLLYETDRDIVTMCPNTITSRME
jgi:hypothetical protein